MIALVVCSAVTVVLWKRGVFRLDRPPSDAIGCTPALPWFLGAIAVYIAVGLIGSGVAAALPAKASDPVAVALAQSIGMYGVAIPVCIWLLGVLRQRFRDRRFQYRTACLAIGALALVMSAPALFLASEVAALVQALVEQAPLDQVAHPTLELIVQSRGDPRMWGVLFGAVIGAPVFEETVYRGLLQTSVWRATGNRWTAVIVTAALFALSHRMGSPAIPWHALAPIFVLGAVCGMLVERYGIWSAITLHSVFNASQVLLALVLVDGKVST